MIQSALPHCTMPRVHPRNLKLRWARKEEWRHPEKFVHECRWPSYHLAVVTHTGMRRAAAAGAASFMQRLHCTEPLSLRVPRVLRPPPPRPITVFLYRIRLSAACVLVPLQPLSSPPLSPPLLSSPTTNTPRRLAGLCSVQAPLQLPPRLIPPHAATTAVVTTVVIVVRCASVPATSDCKRVKSAGSNRLQPAPVTD